MLSAFLGVYMAWARAKRIAKDTLAHQEVVAEKKNIPASLYPVINPDICMGSMSCISACPEGDIIGLVDGAGRLVNATHCIGHGRCEAECPVSAIKLVMGTAQRGVDLPNVGESFETARAGVHIIGELGGMGLIKNAVKQGVLLGNHFGTQLKDRREGVLDVAIVGAGPAGIALGVTCMHHKLKVEVLEQSAAGGTIFNYPRQKVVMTETMTLPGFGKIGDLIVSKEDLLAAFTTAIKKTGVKVRSGVLVNDVQGADGNFTVGTSQGPVKARKVVLAVGRAGTPRKLGVPGEDLPKVTYRLIDFEQYKGKRMLVVGGGDSAVEAAYQLASENGGDVSISYRDTSFSKCKTRNRDLIMGLAEQKKIRLLLGTQVTEITPTHVKYKLDGAEQKPIPNDFVIVCAGGELPVEFLKKAGVTMTKLYGDQLGGPEVTEGGSLKPAKLSDAMLAERKHLRRLTWSLLIPAVLIMAALAYVGRDYYLLRPLARVKSPLHSLLRPSGPIGHGIGVVATVVMLTNFLFALRKRWSRMKMRGNIRGWMTVHVWVGILAPPIIAFHTAFQSKNILATSTTVAMATVTLTGLIGRFIFQMIPANSGGAIDLVEVLAHWERLKERLDPLVDRLRHPAPVREFLLTATSPARGGSVLLFVAQSPFDYVRAWAHVTRIRHLFPDRGDFLDFKDAFWRMWWLRSAVVFHKSLKRLMSSWRTFHVVLAVFMAALILAHVALEIYLGYKWIF